MPTEDDLEFLTRRAELRAAQRLGLLPDAGEISARCLAAALGLSRHRVDRLTRTALAKLRDGLSRRGVPVTDLRALRTLVSSHRQPHDP